MDTNLDQQSWEQLSHEEKNHQLFRTSKTQQRVSLLRGIDHGGDGMYTGAEYLRIIALLFCCVCLTSIGLSACLDTGIQTVTNDESTQAETIETDECDTALSSKEAFIFPGDYLYLFHGKNPGGGEYYENLKGFTEKEDTNSSIKLYMMRITKDTKDYQIYRETLAAIYPPADMSAFPDIPKEWFQENSLLTLFIVDEIVGEKITIEGRVDTGTGYYLFIKTDEGRKLTGIGPARNCATILIPVTKKQSDEWKDIGIYLAGEGEDFIIPIDEMEMQLKMRFSETVELAYKEAIHMHKGKEAAERAYLTIDKKGALISDGDNDDIVFPVRIRLQNEALLSPKEASRPKTYGELMHYRNAVYERFAKKYKTAFRDAFPPVGSHEIEDLDSWIPEGHLFYYVTVPHLEEILKDDQVAFICYKSVLR